MKAVVYDEYGGPDVLHVAEVEPPTPKGDEIVVRVRAAEVTKSDCELRSFDFPVKWFWLPMRLALGVRRPKRPILGAYFAGEVQAVGDGVSTFAVGDEVYGSSQLRLGAYGEVLCVPDSYTVVPKPTNMSFEQAAAVPLGGLNALHFLRLAEVQEGDAVLVNGAGGSIGTFGIQIARSMGAEVTAVDAGHKEQMLLDLGAKHFIDYEQQDFASNAGAYDVVFNMVASRSFASCMAALKPGGRYVTANPKLSDMLRATVSKPLHGKKAAFAFAGEKPEELRDLTAMIEAGDLSATVDQIFPMSEAAQAHHRVETEQRLGSIVLTLG